MKGKLTKNNICNDGLSKKFNSEHFKNKEKIWFESQAYFFVCLNSVKDGQYRCIIVFFLVNSIDEC